MNGLYPLGKPNPTCVVFFGAHIQIGAAARRAPAGPLGPHDAALVVAPHLAVPYIPKHHLWVHLTFGARRLGSPWAYHTFRDEGDNQILKHAAISSHQGTFERRVLARVREATARSDRKRAQKRGRP